MNIFCLFLIIAVKSEDGEVPISAKIRDEITFEFSINGHGGKFLTIGLFSDVVPKTVKNFVKLSLSNHFPSYKNTIVHRVSSYMIQEEVQHDTQVYKRVHKAYIR